MSLDKQALFWLAVTLGGYLLSRTLYRRFQQYWLSPIVFVPVLLFALAIPMQARYADYARDTSWLVALLGPATVRSPFRSGSSAPCLRATGRRC